MIDQDLLKAANAEAHRIGAALGIQVVEPNPDKPGLCYWVADADQGARIEAAHQLLAEWFHRWKSEPTKKEARKVLTAADMRL